MAARDLTRGSLPRHLFSLALPVVAGMSLQSVYALVDLAWVRKLGTEAVGGLSISLQVFFIVLALAQVLSATALADISSDWGAGQRERARQSFSAFMLVGLGLGVVTAVVGFAIAPQYVAAFTDSPGVLEQGLAYFRVNSLTFFTQLLLIVTGYGFRGTGDFTTPMKVMAVGVVTNTLLDPLLMFGVADWEGLGIRGAAVATVISQCIGIVLYTRLLVNQEEGRLGFRRPSISRSFFVQILKRGLPAGLQFFLMSAVLGLVLQAMKPHGEVWTGIAGGGFRVLQQGLLPLVAIGSAGAAIAGQNLGAGNLDRIRKTARLAVGSGVVYATLGSLVMVFFGRGLGRLFAQPDELQEAATYFLWTWPQLFATTLSLIPAFMMQSLKMPVRPMLAAVLKVVLLGGAVFYVLQVNPLGPEWTFGAASVTALVEGVLGTAILFWSVRRLKAPIPQADGTPAAA